jgi:predicted NACHT family NTPase
MPDNMPPDAAICTFRRLVVLGSPGMGKTTMFRYIAYTVSRLGLGLARADEFLLQGKNNLVPLYFPLSEIVDLNQDLTHCLKVYVRKRFPGCHLLTDQIDGLLENGQCLLLLDSLDEIASNHFPRVVEIIKGFLHSADW